MAWTTNGTLDQLYADPVNGGVGFGNWASSKTTSANSGFNLGDSTLGAGNVNAGAYNNSFIVFGHTSTQATAIRPIADTLSEQGDFLTFKFSVNFRNGQKGIRLLNSSNTLIYLFQAVGGTPDKYETYEPTLGYQDTGWSYISNGVYTLAATRGASSTSVVVSRSDGQTVTRTVNDSIKTIEFFCQNTGSSVAQNNLYFNSLSTVNPYRA